MKSTQLRIGSNPVLTANLVKNKIKYMVQKVVIVDLAPRGTESYANLAARNEVAARIQHNNVMFNHTYKVESNLIDNSDYHTRFKKTNEEKALLKKLKANLGKSKEEFVKAFINSPLPNWNIKFTLI